MQSLLDSIAGRLTGNSILNSNATSGEESLQNLETLTSLVDKVDAAGKARLALNSEWKPRIERLADKYDLEGLERELFTCSFVMQVSRRPDMNVLVSVSPVVKRFLYHGHFFGFLRVTLVEGLEGEKTIGQSSLKGQKEELVPTSGIDVG